MESWTESYPDCPVLCGLAILGTGLGCCWLGTGLGICWLGDEYCWLGGAGLCCEAGVLAGDVENMAAVELPAWDLGNEELGLGLGGMWLFGAVRKLII